MPPPIFNRLAGLQAGPASSHNIRPHTCPTCLLRYTQHARTPSRRAFHNYFVTHLPSSSVHPDSRHAHGPRHGLPRDKSVPHDLSSTPGGRSPSAAPPPISQLGPAREMTVVRIPLRSAKHHFGVSLSRGTRPYNEDSFQAGTIEIPAFARRRPISLNIQRRGLSPASEATSAESASGDPQVFYFGVFDGHGGAECSGFLAERLHEYVEEAAHSFDLVSSLKKQSQQSQTSRSSGSESSSLGQPQQQSARAYSTTATSGAISDSDLSEPERLAAQLVKSWKEMVGGYFKRFKPEYFTSQSCGRGKILASEAMSQRQQLVPDEPDGNATAQAGRDIAATLSYAFLKADYDFCRAQASKQVEDHVQADRALNADDILDAPSLSSKPIGGATRFKGGSTCSVALISTPTPTPFWNPASPSTLVTSHVGDTRILICPTATGSAVPLTTDHHPRTPGEEHRLRRYAATFVTDSFGEERMSGLANTRAFGDVASKRIGVSAEPEIRRLELGPAEYCFLVLVSDGVSGVLNDQEIVDIVKEARTPDQGARDVVSFATEVGGGNADNATALVIRLGGWERRSEGSVGSLGTKESRDWKRQEASDPRASRQ